MIYALCNCIPVMQVCVHVHVIKQYVLACLRTYRLNTMFHTCSTYHQHMLNVYKSINEYSKMFSDCGLHVEVYNHTLMRLSYVHHSMCTVL